jgi:hypothetical protein
MDYADLPAGYLTAGREYLERLNALGLEPEGLFWVLADLAFDPAAKPTLEGPWTRTPEWRLFLATSTYDEAGPLTIYRLLFRAYNASLLPKTISPFLLQLTSPMTAVSRALMDAMTTGSIEGGHLNPTILTINGKRASIPTGAPQVKIGEYTVSRDWMIVLRRTYPAYSHRVGQLRKFAERVNELAA